MPKDQAERTQAGGGGERRGRNNEREGANSERAAAVRLAPELYFAGAGAVLPKVMEATADLPRILVIYS